MSLVDYEFAREDRLLLDANVWLLIYGPRKPSDSRVPLYYAQGKHDFNDRVLTYLCKRERLTLITDDAGFRGSDVAILTANRYLF